MCAIGKAHNKNTHKMIKPDKKTLAAHLKQLRENKRLSQESLGKIATDNEGFNVPNVRRTVSDWENPDKGFPSADKIARICVFFQITPTELLFEKDSDMWELVLSNRDLSIKKLSETVNKFFEKFGFYDVLHKIDDVELSHKIFPKLSKRNLEDILYVLIFDGELSSLRKEKTNYPKISNQEFLLPMMTAGSGLFKNNIFMRMLVLSGDYFSHHPKELQSLKEKFSNGIDLEIAEMEYYFDLTKSEFLERGIDISEQILVDLYNENFFLTTANQEIMLEDIRNLLNFKTNYSNFSNEALKTQQSFSNDLEQTIKLFLKNKVEKSNMNQFEKIIISDELNNLLERFYKDTGASY
ncbi:hypothetical protein ATX49_06290, partial [Oenococcus oeni]